MESPESQLGTLESHLQVCLLTSPKIEWVRALSQDPSSVVLRATKQHSLILQLHSRAVDFRPVPFASRVVVLNPGSPPALLHSTTRDPTHAVNTVPPYNMSHDK